MWSRNNYIALIIILTSVIFGMALLVMLPAVKNIRQEKERIEAERQKLEGLLAKGQSIEKVKENFFLVSEEMLEMEKIFIKNGEELDFITELEDIATQNKIDQKISLSPKEENGGDSIKTSHIVLDLEGKINNILFYLNGLEQMDYYINFYEIDITPIQAEGIQTNSRPIYTNGEVKNTDDSAETAETEQGGKIKVRAAGLAYWQ